MSLTGKTNCRYTVLVTYRKTTKPRGWDRPLSWQDDFIKAALAARLISDPVKYDLYDAFYGPKPMIQPLPRIREDSDQFQFAVRYGNTWEDHAGFDVKLVWIVNRVLIDGKEVDAGKQRKYREEWNGLYKGGLLLGDHEMQVEVEAAYIDRKKLIGLNADDLPKKNWPTAGKRWKQTVSQAFEVYSNDASLVDLSTDPDHDPAQSMAIDIKRCVIQSNPSGGAKVILQLDFNDSLTIPLSCDVAIKLGEETVPLGSRWAIRTPNRSSTGGGLQQKRIEPLDPAIRMADIILTPNPKYIEQRPDVKEIWGKEIILRGVPIERLDLEVPASTQDEK